MPGLKRIASSFLIEQLAIIVASELRDQQREDRGRLRLVPNPHLPLTAAELTDRRRGCLMKLCAHLPLGDIKPANETEGEESND